MKNLSRALAFVCVVSSLAGTAGAQSATTTPVCKLQGQYAFLFSGLDFNTGMVGRAGEFTINSSGTVTGGTQDGVHWLPKTVTSGPITSGSCTASSKGLDTLTLTANGVTTSYQIVVTKAGNARMMEFDQNGVTGSGIIRKQDRTAFSLANLAGDWAFSFAGLWDSATGGTLEYGTIGRATVARSGAITSGVVEASSEGAPSVTTPLIEPASAITAPSGTSGRGTLTQSYDFAGIPENPQFAFYVVSANELMVLETDSGDRLLLGEQLRQTGGPFSNASANSGMVFSLTGTTGNYVGTDILIGQVSGDGRGNLSGEFDENLLGRSYPSPTSGTYFVGSDGTGYAWVAARPFSLVMIAPNTAYLLQGNQFLGPAGAWLTVGQTEPQATTLSAQGLYRSGTVVAPVFGDINGPASGGAIYFVGTASLGSGALREGYDDSYFCNQNLVNQANLGLSATYTVTKGRIVVTGSLGRATAGYVISPSKFVVIGWDFSGCASATALRFEQ